MIEFAESPIAMPGYLDVAGNPITGAYQDLPGSKEAAYQDVKAAGAGGDGGDARAGYQDVPAADGAGAGVGYVAVSPQGIGGEPAPIGEHADAEEGSGSGSGSDEEESDADEDDIEEC